MVGTPARHDYRCLGAILPEKPARRGADRRGPLWWRHTADGRDADPGATLELNFEVEQSGISMDEVVVSASRSATLRREAPALVSVLDAGLFERANASCLAQGLAFQPGVRVEDDCQNCGSHSPHQRTRRPLFADSDRFSPGLFGPHGVYGLEQIPANMIERVEVLRGGGSALYGSSAIGGRSTSLPGSRHAVRRSSRTR